VEFYRKENCNIRIYTSKCLTPVIAISGVMSKTLAEGTSFFTDDKNLPPHLQITFISFMLSGGDMDTNLDTFNLDHKVCVCFKKLLEFD
jgi:hypothetical protein